MFAETAMMLGDNKGFLEKFCKDMRDAQNKRGTNAFTATVPDNGFGSQYIGDTGWADAGILLPYRLYKMYGDTTILKDS